MSSIVISGDTSGSITVAAPAVAGTYTQTLPMITGTLGTLNSGTAVASTSGTSIDFTSLPANIRRITVMFNGVSTNGTSFTQIQIGSTTFTTTGYASQFWGGTSASAVITTGFGIFSIASAANSFTGSVVLTNITGNTWVSNGNMIFANTTSVGWSSAGSLALGGTLDRVRITSVNGTDTFDAGSINILYE
jgi:hypothetical protein